jgi:hypothetical protein
MLTGMPRREPIARSLQVLQERELYRWLELRLLPRLSLRWREEGGLPVLSEGELQVWAQV